MWLIAGLRKPRAPAMRGIATTSASWSSINWPGEANISSFRSKFGGEIATGLWAGRNVLLLKPMEYMNHSGYALQRASHFHHIDVEETIVIHDEIDLDFGRLRLKAGGGHGGHNGLRSIVEQLGERDFLRIRMGIGKARKNRSRRRS